MRLGALRRSPTPTRASTQVLIVTPDKDLGQCVRGTRVVQYDRRKDEIVDEAAVTAKFGVGPASIADYLALVGDSADGFPGLARLGREERCRRAGEVRLDRPTFRRRRPTGGSRHCAAPRSWRSRSATNSSLRCCSGASPRSRSTSTVGAVDDWRWTGPTDGFAADLRPARCAASRSNGPSAWRTTIGTRRVR